MNTLWGLGKKIFAITFHDNLHFKGYGKINHKSVDLGIPLWLYDGMLGTLSLQYARRVYAYNFPKNANLVLLKY